MFLQHKGYFCRGMSDHASPSEGKNELAEEPDQRWQTAWNTWNVGHEKIEFLILPFSLFTLLLSFLCVLFVHTAVPLFVCIIFFSLVYHYLEKYIRSSRLHSSS